MMKIAWLFSIIPALVPSVIHAGSAGKLPSDCDDAQVWYTHLQDNYGEQYAKEIVIGQDAKAEVWVDPAEGDWTVLTVAGDKRCMWGYGEEWPQEWR